MNLDPILAYASAVLSLALAGGAALRAGRSLSRWAFVIGLSILAGESIIRGLLARSVSPEALALGQIRGLTLTALLPASWLLFSLTYARGNADFFLKKWRLVLLAALALPVALVLGFRDRLLDTASLLAVGNAAAFNLGPAGIALHAMVLGAGLLVLVNLERTYRASVGTVRWRIKFMLMGVGLLFTVRIFTASQALLFHGLSPALEGLHSVALLLACVLLLRSLVRAGHFDLDVYPSQTVLRSSATIFITGLYLVIVGLFAKVVAYLGGDSSFSLKALIVLVGLVGLAILLQSDRTQMRLRHFISRHFQRPLYDSQAIWRQFTEGTASQVGLTDYSRAVVRLLAEIFQALSVTFWIVQNRQTSLELAASTSVQSNHARIAGPVESEALAIIRHLHRHPAPVEIEHLTEPWAEALRRCHPDEFHKGSRRICVPLVAGGELQAVIILGDRVSGTLFGPQDFDLLQAIAGHVATGVLNIRLSQHLLQTREHEAFQAMATFFVHDLKNAATTLNLMLKNLPDHFDDPEFREDALRGVGKTVAHINSLISRLSQLRQEMKITPAPSDLNGLVNEVLARAGQAEGIRTELALTALPAVPLDRDQMAKVVTNLVINAREAMGAGGTLHLSTQADQTWATLAVSDTGCGMSADFISKSLFRPFQTTKKNGLGIGMFHSKMIVEAHGGRLTVESTPGLGTTFRVHLPLRDTPH